MAFSYQAPHHPFDLLDSSVYLPRTPVVETLLIPHQAAGDHLSTTTAAASSSSSFTTTTFPYSPSDAHLLRSPTTVPKKEINCMKKKRKSGDEESRITGEYSKDGKDTSTKHKGAKRKAKDEDKKASNEACSDPTGGYIHVRARRGQATDSHSLAERVRREKISERMKMLQGLVPGCEKVTGKALMLDEIINYVQSLQNQVEFLSMRIASLSPVLYDFNVDLDDCINQHQKMLRSNMPQTLPSLDQANKAFDNGQANYQVMEYSPFQVVQGPTAFSQVDGGSGLHDAQRLGFIDQLGFINMCSFQ